MTPALIGELTMLLARRSARSGDFVLASGRTSDFYIDVRQTSMSPDGLVLLGRLGLDRIRTEYPEAQAVGGLTMGADPIAYAIAMTSAATERPLRAFTVRKEAKGHGTARLVEGPFLAGDRVVVIEDVITTGSSALRATEAVTAAGGSVLGVLAVVDREEGGVDALQGAGFPVSVLVRRSDLQPLL